MVLCGILIRIGFLVSCCILWLVLWKKMWSDCKLLLLIGNLFVCYIVVMGKYWFKLYEIKFVSVLSNVDVEEVRWMCIN